MIGGWRLGELYSARRIASAAAILILAVAPPLLARADAVVNLCQSADQPGSGTNLRQALTHSLNPNNATNNITFQCGDPATITVDGTPLEILQPTAIDGGNAVTLIGTGSSFRSSLFVVALTGNFLYLRNLTLTHPNTQRQFRCDASTCIGTVLNAQGVTELDNVLIQNTDTPILATSGSLTVSRSRFIGNSGSVIVAGPGVTSTIVGSVFENNHDAVPILANGTIGITGSQFRDSYRSSFRASCQLTIDNSTFQNNADAALEINCASTAISNSLFAENNTGAAAPVGGAIVFLAGAQQITLRTDRFVNNNAPFRGGALWFSSPETTDRSVSISHSTFAGNKGADGGGAIYIEKPKNSTVKTVMKLQGVSFSRNVATGAVGAGTGGAISAIDAELLVARSVFADNDAKAKGGAVALDITTPLHPMFANTFFIRNHAASGSAYSGDHAEFINTTVDSNQGLAIDVGGPPRLAIPIRLTNSIVSNNSQGGCGPANAPTGSFRDGGHNLQFPGTDCGASIPVANPRLDTMYIPLPLSPAMGHGDVGVCVKQPVNGRDIYGSARPSGGKCTIGAAEGVIQKREPCRSLGPDQPNKHECYKSLINQLQGMLPSSH
jgi:hypothetical protein